MYFENQCDRFVRNKFVRKGLFGSFKQVGSVTGGLKEFKLRKLFIEFSEISKLSLPKMKILSKLFRYIFKPLLKWCK